MVMRRAAVVVALALTAIGSACSSDAARSDGGTGTIDRDATVIDIDASATGDADTAGDGGTARDAPAAPRRICDGSDDIRLAYSVPVSPTSVFAFTAELYELGTEFLYVDGRCHYWMQEPLLADRFGAWRAYREGELTAAHEAALHDAVSYDDFAAGAPPCIGPLATDA